MWKRAFISLWLFSLGLLFGLQFFLPSHGVASDGNALVVSGEVDLEQSSSPYVFDSLTVTASGSLRIAPGVVIQIAEGGSIVVNGELVALGTESLPVTFSGIGSAYWQGFTANPGAGLSVGSLQFIRSTQPIRLLSQISTIGDLKIIDGLQNVVQFGQSNTEYPRLSAGAFQFINRDAGVAMQESGLLFQGNHPYISINGVSFIDERPLQLQESLTMFVRIEGAYGEAYFGNLIFPYKCPAAVSQSTPGVIFELTPNRSACPDIPLPIVFVPGYGTSINLERLTNPDLIPVQADGWRFFKQLDPSYFAFLAAAKARHIAVEVAYYDWRLPASLAAKNYLEPLIQKTENEYGVSQVNLVAHSFGGLVSRAYIQGQDYRNDVQKFIEVGTPNAGAAKIYSAWEGGVLPDDWQALTYLLKFYEYQTLHKQTDQQLIQEIFPSSLDIFPTYSFLSRAKKDVPADGMAVQNLFLKSLNITISDLFNRTKSWIVASRSEPTQVGISVGKANPGQTVWPDGKPTTSLGPEINGGDGTVPWTSATYGGIPVLEVAGLHQDLPNIGSDLIFNTLYGDTTMSSLTPTKPGNTVSFFFDCPIAVTIQLPDGQKRASTDSDLMGVGEVENSSNLLWMMLPREIGKYTIGITALADTAIRNWIENGTALETNLQMGQSEQEQMTIAEDGSLSAPSLVYASPVAVAQPSVSPSPSASSVAAVSLRRISSDLVAKIQGLVASVLFNIPVTPPPFMARMTAQPYSVALIKATSVQPAQALVQTTAPVPKGRVLDSLTVVGFLLLVIFRFIFKIVKPPEICDDG